MHAILRNLDKEHKFLNHLCKSILRINRKIKFVSVVTKNGELLVGRSRSTDMKSIQYICSLNGRIFYLKYLIFTLNNIKRRYGISTDKKSSFDNHNDESIFFEVTGSYNDGILVVTSLSKNQEKFLCIYFGPVSRGKVQPVYTPEKFNNLLAKIDYNLL